MELFSWSVRRQLIILGAIIIVLAVPVSYVLFSYVHVPPTCFDGKKNQDEAGPDCGGSCLLQCASHVSDLVIIWSKVLKVLPGVYDAVAFVENQNITSGIKNISYSFTLYDKNNLLVSERKGSTFVNPNEQFAIYEPAINVGERLPVKAFFEFTEDPVWIRVSGESLRFSVKNSRLLNLASRPRLNATILNESLVNAENVVLTALLFDKRDNVVAVSQTIVDFLPKGASKDVAFIWPGKFDHKPEVCVSPLDVMLVFDRSGSMNDDGGNPPQPLTDAKSAAQGFIDTLSKIDQVGVVSFATGVTAPPDQTLTFEHARAKKSLDEISIPPEEEVGFTNLGEGIHLGTKELLSIRNNPNAKKTMVILTDGLANAPEAPGGEIYAEEKARVAKEAGIVLFSIGLGASVNADFLREKVSSDKARYYAAEDRNKLFDVYKEIAEEICPQKTYPMTILPRINLVEGTR